MTPSNGSHTSGIGVVLARERTAIAKPLLNFKLVRYYGLEAVLTITPELMPIWIMTAYLE